MAGFDLAWGVAAVVGVVALGLAIRVGGEPRRAAGLRAELDELRKASKAGRKHEEQREKALRLAEAELDKAKRKLAQRDKRDAQSKGSARAEREAAGERMRALEAELEEMTTRLGSAESDLARKQDEFEVAIRRAASAEARAEAAQLEAAAAPPPADPEELRILRERSESAEHKLAERDEALARASAEVERLKKKAVTQETLYTSLRSELSVKKDQIRQQREELERLRAVRVALGGVDEAAE